MVIMYVGEMPQLMVPVRTLPTVRCSAKVIYCTKEGSGRELVLAGRTSGKRYAKSASQRWACEIPWEERKVNQPFCNCKEVSQ